MTPRASATPRFAPPPAAGRRPAGRCRLAPPRRPLVNHRARPRPLRATPVTERRPVPGLDALAAAVPRRAGRVWLFDLDDTLHDATHAVFAPNGQAMTDYIVRHLGLDPEAAAELRRRYWKRYGATLLGLVRHHGVRAAHFLHETHLLPGLEERLRMSAHDRAALARLRGRKVILTNAPRAYALRVLGALGLARQFDAVLAIEDMAMFGSHRPKPDARMLRHVAARLKVSPRRCVLVEDTLVHQKAAHGIGMATVWMRRYQRTRPPAGRAPLGATVPHLPPGAERAPRRCPKPAYVGRRIVSLQALRGW